MKVIINIAKKNNLYAKRFNGKTFQVHTILSNGVSVLGMNQNFPNNQTDFTFNEVIIVDIETEFQKAKRRGDSLLIEKLKTYIELKKIDIDIS